MAYLTEAEVRARAARVPRPIYKSAPDVLWFEGRPAAAEQFDIFLSHSTAEPEDILLGVKGFLEDRGLTVYVDKYGDPELSPDSVTRETAVVLRHRMRQSEVLLYVHSRHSQKSRWMPWELGFFDALKGKVGIVPVTLDQEETFKHEEYLSLYPYVDVRHLADPSEPNLRINTPAGHYASLAEWARGVDTIWSRL